MWMRLSLVRLFVRSLDSTTQEFSFGPIWNKNHFEQIKHSVVIQRRLQPIIFQMMWRNQPNEMPPPLCFINPPDRPNDRISIWDKLIHMWHFIISLFYFNANKSHGSIIFFSFSNWKKNANKKQKISKIRHKCKYVYLLGIITKGQLLNHKYLKKAIEIANWKSFELGLCDIPLAQILFSHFNWLQNFQKQIIL